MAPQTPINQYPPAGNTALMEQDAGSVMSEGNEEIEALKELITSMSIQMEIMREALNNAMRIQLANVAENRHGIERINNLVTTAMTGKEAGEILKPAPPEAFDGTPYKLRTFVL